MVEKIERSLASLDAGRGVPHDEVLAMLDALEPEAPSAKRHPPETEEAYRARLIAKIERGLADVEAGRVHTHAEVLEAIAARFGWPDRATLADVTDEAGRILDAALELPEGERALIAAILEDSIGDGSSPAEVEASWLAEAKRRLAAYRRGESSPVDVEDAMRTLESKPRRPRERRASTG